MTKENFKHDMNILSHRPALVGLCLAVPTCQRWVNRTGSIEVLHWDGGHAATQREDNRVSVKLQS